MVANAAVARQQAEEILKAKKTIIELLSRHTGLTPERIAEETERDKYLTAQQAKEYGLIDDVLHQDNKDKKESKSFRKTCFTEIC